MSDDRSPRLALPLLQPGQAQKESDHNEALALLDIAVQASVSGVGVNIPPTDPVAGECWIVGAAPVGAWAGNAAALAGWTEGGWRFLAPVNGMKVWSAPDNLPAQYNAGNWRLGDVHALRVIIGGVQIVGERRAAIPDPSGGSNIDSEARDTLHAVLEALREHGLIE